MVTLDQYPHYLYYQTTTPATQDANGTWQQGTTQWNYLCRCRVERNGQALSITTTDGKVYQFTATVYMPRNSATTPLAFGTRALVSLTEQDPETLTDAAIKQGLESGVFLIDKPNATFEIGRLHNRMWL